VQDVWWEQDIQEGVWWYKPTSGWHMWKSTNRADPGHSVGGWMMKTAAICHMPKHGHEDSLRYVLKILQEHHSLKPAIEKMERDWTKHGFSAWFLSDFPMFPDMLLATMR